MKKISEEQEWIEEQRRLNDCRNKNPQIRCRQPFCASCHQLDEEKKAMLNESAISKAINATIDEANKETVNHPPHYQSSNGLEVIDIIEAFELNFNFGNAIKYILRAGKKGDFAEDLKKAVWYLQREINRYPIVSDGEVMELYHPKQCELVEEDASPIKIYPKSIADMEIDILQFYKEIDFCFYEKLKSILDIRYEKK